MYYFSLETREDLARQVWTLNIVHAHHEQESQSRSFRNRSNTK
jgi:hypothetical protein